jgi:eukaryotic-like serine/threonine-protein kinase
MIGSLGHYKVLDKIGAGALGELYRARDTRVGRTIALRIIAPAIADSPERLEAFLRDARASAAVSHPNIAAVYEVAREGDTHYLACEFVAGQTLKSLISGRPLNPRRAIDLTVQVADAIADAYANELVHGDLRAEAIIVNAKGNAKLLDFGLAKWTADIRQKGDDGQPGNAEESGADHQADIAALGVMLHEMLTGAPPSAGAAPSDIDAHLPKELDAIVAKTQSVYVNERYQASATLAAELRSVAAILDVRAQAASEVALAPSREERRRKAIVWMVVIAMLGALAWLVWTVSKMR